MSRQLPRGTVTLVFTDIEGSTQLLHALGAEGYEGLLTEHRRIVRETTERHAGVEVDTQGDAFFLAFADGEAAVAAARELQQAHEGSALQVRVGVHTGQPRVTSEGYVGSDVHLAARLGAAGHGGQVLLSASTRALVDVPLTDLGEHRLKDIRSPIAIFQLGSGVFPPLRTISNTNLPRPASSFVGRTREKAEIGALLADGRRLVTLTGPGGTGKTRLAIEVAADLVTSFNAGVFWVPLAPLSDAALVSSAIATTLGARGELAEHIGGREMLLVLDNLEQVIDAAPAIAGLVEACPRLHVLATSRERLRVRGEVAYRVAPLPEHQAIELFCARAGLRADEPIARLCAALENLPLAIELAAARAEALSPAEIMDRLGRRLDLLKGGRDADPRQATLRATIDWSYRLLTGAEQRLFRHLAVFRGGATLEAAETVAEADVDGLQSLLDKSLLSRREGRYVMLETIREYASDRLTEAGEVDTVRDRHLTFYRDLADSAFEAQAELETLPPETDNVRAAIDWAVARGTALDELRTASAVAYFWLESGRTAEAHARLSGALSRHVTPDSIRARGLCVLGYIELVLGAETAEATLREAIDVAAECHDLLSHSQALDSIAHMLMDTDLVAAREALERSVALRRQIGRSREQAESLGSLCAVLLAEGNATEAERVADQVLEMARQLDQRELAQTAMRFLADARLIAGDFGGALGRYLQALRHANLHGLARLGTTAIWGIAVALAAQGDDAQAIRIASANVRQRVAYGLPPLSSAKWWRKLIERYLDESRARLSDSQLAAAEESGAQADFNALINELLARGTEPS